MNALVETSTRTQGGLKVEIDRVAGEHRPPGVAPAEPGQGWSLATASATLPSSRGEVKIEVTWQFARGAIKDAEVAVIAGPDVRGRVRVLLQPLMGTTKDASGAPVARIRGRIEADLEGGGPSTLHRAFVVDGAGRHAEDEG